MVKIVNDNYMYARLVILIKRRDSLSDASLPAITAIVMDETKAQVRARVRARVRVSVKLRVRGRG